MDNIKWQKYLRIPQEPIASSEQEDNMKEYGQHMLPYKNVLDVGCGKGMLVHWLHTKNINAIGITKNPKEIELGKAMYGKDHKIQVGDMHEIPFPDKHFDALHTKDCMEHAIAPYIALCEFNRVLKPNGFCLIVVPDVKQWQTEHYHYSCLYRDQMEALFKKTKFKVIKVTEAPPPVGGTIFTSYFLEKNGDIEL